MKRLIILASIVFAFHINMNAQCPNNPPSSQMIETSDDGDSYCSSKSFTIELIGGKPSGVNVQWQRREFGSTWQNVGSNSSSLSQSNLSDGDFQYRAELTCSNNSQLVTQTNVLDISIEEKCNIEPLQISQDEITKAIALVDHFGYKFTGTLVNNNDEDGRYLFITSSYPFNNNCDNGEDIGSILNDIKFTWDGGERTTGADILINFGEIAVLELHKKPPFKSPSYLGVDINTAVTSGQPDRCISYYKNSVSQTYKSEFVKSSFTTANVATVCNFAQDDEYTFNTSNWDAYNIKQWSSSTGNMKKDAYSKGAPLLDKDNFVIGIYVTKTKECECDKDNAHFVTLQSHWPYISTWFDNVTRGVSIEKCEDVVNIVNPIFSDSIVRASISISGSSVLSSNAVVLFQAEEEIILEDGFVSGNDFVSEILPCDDVKITLPKNNIIRNENNDDESVKSLAESNFTESKELNIRAYPTIIVDDRLTLEITNIESVAYKLVDLQGKILLSNEFISIENGNKQIINLPTLSKGTYILHLSDGVISKTVKLIKQ